MLLSRGSWARRSRRAAALYCLAAMMHFVPLGGAWAAKDDSEPAVDQSFSTTPERTGSRRSDSVAVRAVDAAISGKLAASRELAAQSGDPVAVKLVEWLYLKDGWRNAGYDRVMRFVNANPAWPGVDTLERQAETLLFMERTTGAPVLIHFAKQSPSLPEGRIALARTELAMGNTERARKLVVEAFTNVDLSTTGFEVIRNEFKALLSRQDYEMRLWKLIHAQLVTASLKTATLISNDHLKAAQVAGMLLRGQRGAVAQYKGLPAEFRRTQALRYALARYYRKADQIDEARAILVDIPASHAKLVDPEAWWIERRLVVRNSLGPRNKANWQTAYKLASAHGYSEGEHFCEGEFLAGWIALRMLNDPKTALKHFSRIGPNSPNRTEASRGYYWTGRAYSALGDKAQAAIAYRSAASSPTLYYSQLARDALGKGSEPVPIAKSPVSEKFRIEAGKDELVRAFTLLADAGAQRELGAFLKPLAARFKTREGAAAVASIVSREGGAFMAVRFAKAASTYGVDIDDWGYPSKAIPSWQKLGKPVEKAAVFGLTRQESEFNARAVSHAGARGLMQLMPGTAKLVARQHNVAYSEGKLSDPAYNVKLGAAHLGDLVAGYNGSYILTFVAYNAGPRRAREWIAQYGDPRSPNVDPIDWVESVPFTETRKYIQKVLQNIHVYRSRLDPDTVKPMSSDLGRGAAHNIKRTVEDDKSASCGQEALSLSSLIHSC